MHFQIILCTIVFAAGLVVGGVCVRRDKFISAFGFMGAGLLAGLIVGLSESPLLATLATSTVGIVGALAPLMLEARKPREPGEVPQRLQVGQFLAPFAIFAIVGMLAGITLRVNDTLNFQDENLRGRLTKLGFNSPQIDRLLDMYIEDPGETGVVAQAVHGSLEADPGTSLLANKQNRASWTKIWKVANLQSMPNVDDRLGFVMSQAPRENRQQIDKLVAELTAQSTSKDKILERLKMQFPGEEE